MNGFNVVANLNEGRANPPESPLGYIFIKEMMELLTQEADIYFLNLDGWNRFPYATLLTEINLRCHLVSKDELFYLISMDDRERVLGRLAEFFGFTQRLLRLHRKFQHLAFILV